MRTCGGCTLAQRRHQLASCEATWVIRITPPAYKIIPYIHKRVLTKSGPRPVSDSVRTVDQDGKSSFKTPLSFLWLVSLCTLDDSAQWLSYPNASSSQTSLMESEKKFRSGVKRGGPGVDAPLDAPGEAPPVSSRKSRLRPSAGVLRGVRLRPSAGVLRGVLVCGPSWLLRTIASSSLAARLRQRSRFLLCSPSSMTTTSAVAPR